MDLVKIIFFLASIASQSYSSDIILSEIRGNEKSGLNLKYESKSYFESEVIDPDGRLLLLTTYSILLEEYVEKLYKGEEKWSRIKNLQINDFSKFRPLFQAAMQTYVQKNKDSAAAKELNSILKLPWMKSGNPGLDEFANKTIGSWLASEVKNWKLSFYYKMNPKKGKSFELRKTIPVLLEDPSYPVSAYLAARPLALPPTAVSKDRDSMKLGPLVQKWTPASRSN